MGRRSLRLLTWVGETAAAAWHAPGRPTRPPYQWRRGSHRDRAPEQHSGRSIPTHARFASLSQPWEGAHSDCSRGLVSSWRYTKLPAPFGKRGKGSCPVSLVIAAGAPLERARGAKVYELLAADGKGAWAQWAYLVLVWGLAIMLRRTCGPRGLYRWGATVWRDTFVLSFSTALQARSRAILGTDSG